MIDFFGNELAIGDTIFFSDSDDWDYKGKILKFTEDGKEALILPEEDFGGNPNWYLCENLKKEIVND